MTKILTFKSTLRVDSCMRRTWYYLRYLIHNLFFLSFVHSLLACFFLAQWLEQIAVHWSHQQPPSSLPELNWLRKLKPILIHSTASPTPSRISQLVTARASMRHEMEIKLSDKWVWKHWKMKWKVCSTKSASCVGHTQKKSSLEHNERLFTR